MSQIHQAQISTQLNTSNLKVICRIRPPKSYESQRETKKGLGQQQNVNSPSSSSKHYTCIRNRTRSSSKGDISSPLKNYQSVRNASRESSGKRSSSRGKKGSLNKSNSFQGSNNGYIQEDKKYSIFTTRERSNIVVACENSVPGKLINESLCDTQDLKYFNTQFLGSNSSYTFNFDSVFNETHKQEKFYSSAIRPIVKSFVEGENACILLFGPTESGKTHTLKGKTGMERGILPRAVEDVFNIVKNSEERDEDFEMFRNDMMNTSSDYPEQDYMNSARNGQRSKYEQQEIVPERMFLKVCVYQIFVDKVIDLLSGSGNNSHTQSMGGIQKGGPHSQKVKIDHYIDKESEEVVSKLKNITEKVVFTLEDFYSVLQEAFKNRRIESVSMQEQDLRKKSHFVISLTMMKRMTNRRLMEISHLNFVELSGSEQAVAEEKFYMDSSVRQFVTKSFNTLSSQILKSALKKRAQVPQLIEDGDSKIVNCLRNTLTSTSNMILVCCVNPGTSYYEHSLPAIKFCARIRDCIIKKLKGKTTRTNHQQLQNQSASLDEIEYNQESDRNQNNRQGGPLETTKELLQHIKDEFLAKKYSLQRYGLTNKGDLDKWIDDQIRTLDKLIQRIRACNQSGSRERQGYVVLDDIQQLKDKLIRLPIDFLSQVAPPNHQSSFGQFNSDQQMASTQRSAGRNGGNFSNNLDYVPTNQGGQIYNPFSSTQTPYDKQFSSTMRSSYDYQTSDNKLYNTGYNQNRDEVFSQERLNTQQYPTSSFKNQSTYNNINTEPSKLDISQTPQFDSQTIQETNQNYSKNQSREQNQHTKLTPRRTLEQNQNNYSDHRPQKYQGGLMSSQNHFTSPRNDNNTIEIETIGDNQTSNYNSKQRSNQIKIYEQSEVNSRLNLQESPKTESGFRSKRGQFQNAQKQGGNNFSASLDMGGAVGASSNLAESDFLNKAHPILEISLTGERNNISVNEQEQVSTKSATTRDKLQNQQKSSKPGFVASNMFNPTMRQPNNSKQEESKKKRSQFMSGLNSLAKDEDSSYQQDFSRQRQKLQSDSVYGNEEEAVNDLARLIKLNDLEGVRLRVLQIYKEKKDQDKLIEEMDNQTQLMGEQLEKKDQLIDEYQQAIKENHEEYQNTIEDLTQQKENSVKEFSTKAVSLTDQVTNLSNKIKSINEEREKFRQENDMFKAENRSLERQKDEAESKYEREKDQLDKLKGNYEMFKEHELNIIKDYEGKKTREITFYEQNLTENHKQIKELQMKEKDLEEQVFRMKEDIRRGDFEIEKQNQDRRHMSEQIEKLGLKLVKEEEQNQHLLMQLEQNAQISQKFQDQLSQVEQERGKAFDEIQKLHLLVEEMERSIQGEQERRVQEHRLREEKEGEVIDIEKEKRELEDLLIRKDGEIQEYANRENDLHKEISQLGKMHNEADRNLILMKAKEYDKVDVLRKIAELEARIKYLLADNENLVKERNNLDLTNVELSHQNTSFQHQMQDMAQELDFFRNTHEELLDKFDQKIEQITTELSKLKNENIALKEKDKNMKKLVQEVEDERDEFRDKFRLSEKKSEEFNMKLFEMENEVRLMMQEREKDMKDQALRQTLESRNKEENKKMLLGDIQNLIKEKRMMQSKSNAIGNVSVGGGSHNSNHQLN